MSLTPVASPGSSRFSPEWVRSLPVEEQQALVRALSPRTNRYLAHWTPTPHQRAFLLLPNTEVFYGGAAGGGKSDALLAAALQYVDVPGYSAVLFRRSISHLKQPDALIPRSRAWLGSSDARWNDNEHQWTFPSGAVVKFGYLSEERHLETYQGAAFHFVGFDEVTQIPEAYYRYLFSRCRRPASGAAAHVPLRVRAAGNPGGRSHDFVKARFITGGGHFIDKLGRAQRRVFVPAKLADNPHLDQETYRNNLLELDPLRLAQLLDGDWDAKGIGEVFRREWFRWVNQAPPGLEWLTYYDLAGTAPHERNPDPDWSARIRCAVATFPDGRRDVYFREPERVRMDPGDLEVWVREGAERDGRNVGQHFEEEGGSGGKTTIHTMATRVLFGWPVVGHRKTGRKAAEWAPLAGQAKRGHVYLVREGATDRVRSAGQTAVEVTGWAGWLDELDAVTGGKDSCHDDQADAAAGAFNAAASQAPFVWASGATPKEPTVKTPEQQAQEWREAGRAW